MVSILLAFAIDAGWDSSQERGEEGELLGAIREDLVLSRGHLREFSRAHARARADFLAFLSLEPDDLSTLSADEVQAMGDALAFPVTFDPVRGAMDAVVTSGRLSLIRDRELRTLLTLVLNQIGEVEEEVSLVRNSAVDVWRAQVAIGGPWGQDTDYLAPLTGEKLMELRRNDDVVGLSRLHHGMIDRYLSELNTVGRLIDRTVAMLAEQAIPN